MSGDSANPTAGGEPGWTEEHFDDAGQQREAATFGMWIFLATEILFFGVLFASYTICRMLYPQGFAIASRHTDLLMGTIESVVLLTSGTLMVLAVRALQLDQRRAATWLLAATALLGVGFLVMHAFEYYREFTEQLVPGINFRHSGPHASTVELFFCLYYAITGFHSLHVLIGVIIIAILALRVARGDFGPRHHTALELSALYWHFVDIVWIFVFPLIYLVGRAG